MNNCIRIFLLLVLFISFGSIQAQNNVVSNAIQAFQEGDYEKTYRLTSEALANQDRLSGDYIPAAYYYLARSRMQLLRLAVEGRDTEKLAGMQNALIESYFDYKEALRTADDKLRADIVQDLQGLYNPILQTGLSALNTANDSRLQENVRDAALKTSMGYLEAARDITPTYLANDLLGQAYMASGDHGRAYDLFGESIAAYLKSPPSPPDFLIAYVFFRKAMIERYNLEDNKKALATLLEGQNTINSEFARLNLQSPDPGLRRDYQNGLLDLVGFELDLYLSDSLPSDEALVRFQEILLIYPEDYDIHIAYAGMLEKVDMNLAIDAYETAISIDESRELAYYNLGAIYNNLGSDEYRMALETEDDEQAEQYFERANDNFRRAYLRMEEAFQRNPQNINTIRALVQIANTLGLEDKASFYRQKENELRGF